MAIASILLVYSLACRLARPMAKLVGAFALIELIWAIAGTWILRAIGVGLCVAIAGLVVKSAR